MPLADEEEPLEENQSYHLQEKEEKEKNELLEILKAEVEFAKDEEEFLTYVSGEEDVHSLKEDTYIPPQPEYMQKEENDLGGREDV